MKKIIFLLILLSVGVFGQGVGYGVKPVLPNKYQTSSVTSGDIRLVNARNQVYTMGNSLTFANLYQRRLGALLGTSWNVVNKGISGNTTTQMASRFASDIVNAKDKVEYVIILGGVNDLTLSDSTVIKTNLQYMYTLAHNAGIKVVAVTILPYRGATDRPWDATRQSYLTSVNDWMKNRALNIDYVVDGYSKLLDSAKLALNWGGKLLPAYASSDSIHLSATGYDTLGAYIYRSVTWAGSTKDSTGGNITVPLGSAYRYNDVPFLIANPSQINWHLANSGNATSTGYNNFSFGETALANLTSGYNNIAIGYGSLNLDTNGYDNIAIGTSVLSVNRTGNSNTAVGRGAMTLNTIGIGNTAVGVTSLISNTQGSNNVSLGMSSLSTNTAGSTNTAIGAYSLQNLTSFNDGNTALGFAAGRYYGTGTSANASGSGNIFIGVSTRANGNGQKNQIVIGDTAIGKGSNTVTLGNDSIKTTYLKGNVSVTSGDYIYLSGDATTDGSWRIGATQSSNCIIEYRTSGAWVAKQTLTP